MTHALSLDAPAPARPGRRRLTLIAAIVAGATLVACAAFIGYRAWANRPPAPNGDPVAIARFSATTDFDKLPIEQREPYIQNLRSHMKELVAAAVRGELSKDEQKAALKNGMRAGAQIELAHYFSLPAGPQRVQLLDKLINEQEQLQQYARQFTKDDTLPRVGTDLSSMKQFIETLPPGDRVRMAEFAFNLFKRRAERGLPLWPYNGGK